MLYARIEFEDAGIAAEKQHVQYHCTVAWCCRHEYEKASKVIYGVVQPSTGPRPFSDFFPRWQRGGRGDGSAFSLQ